MSRAEKREIEKLREEVRGLRNTAGRWQTTCLSSDLEIEALREELHQQKEKYTLLLERYIAMMERTVKLDEQRSD